LIMTQYKSLISIFYFHLLQAQVKTLKVGTT
jgi:hypothetical protein